MVKAVLIRISTQAVVKKSDFPRITVEPIVGLDPDLKWLIVNEVPKQAFDPVTQRLVKVEEITTEAHPVYVDFHQYKIYFNIAALSQEEKDVYAQQQEDIDQASTFFQQRISDGGVMLDRFSSFVYRKVVNGEITKPQAVTILEFFFDAINPLSRGYFELSRKRVNALVTANAGLIALKNRLLTQLDNYLNNE